MFWQRNSFKQKWNFFYFYFFFVKIKFHLLTLKKKIYLLIQFCGIFQHVDEENSYLCGYLKIDGLTLEFPSLTTFFDGEIISRKYPFLTRKWDADEDVDRKHWVIEFFKLF